MKLFHVQDKTYPMYVLADEWQEAIEIWRKRVTEEFTEDEAEDPEGVGLITSDREELDFGAAQRDLLKFKEDVIEALFQELEKAHEINCSGHDSIIRICESLKLPTMRDEDVPF